MSKLDFGCGPARLPGYVGLDVFPGPQVDVVHNFNVYPYPFADDTFEEIRCWSSLEHPDDFMKCVAELHRIAKPNALLRVLVPHYSGPDAYRDPTHKTFFSYFTFDFFGSSTGYQSAYNGMLRVEQRTFGIPENTGMLRTVFKRIFNAMPHFYERYVCWILPTKTMYFELRVVKSRSTT